MAEGDHEGDASQPAQRAESDDGGQSRPALTWVVLAAGIGSRFADPEAPPPAEASGARPRRGLPKQLQPVGPDDSALLEYGLFDALRAGFERVVLVVRPAVEALVRDRLAERLAGRVELEFAHQEPGTGLPEAHRRRVLDRLGSRSRPWGTGHAVLAARSRVSGPFAVVNADDFYGRASIALLAEQLREDTTLGTHHLVGYPIESTLSSEGPVSRGICRVLRGWHGGGAPLRDLVVTPEVERRDGRIEYRDPELGPTELDGDELASMNLWGFSPAIFETLETELLHFLERIDALPPTEQTGAWQTAELGLPSAVLAGIRRKEATVRVWRALDPWIGMTYAGDLELARRAVAELVEAGEYPEELWP